MLFTHDISYPSLVNVPRVSRFQIDNDIPFVEQSFGYLTSVEEASRVLSTAHTEALGAYNGVGLVKLMGRGEWSTLGGVLCVTFSPI